VLIAAPPGRVFEVLLAIERFPLWWPSNLEVRVISPPPHGVGSILEVKTLGSRFRCQIASVDPPREISLDYFTGPHRGRGVWTLDARCGGTEVAYSVDLVPHGFVARALSHVLNFPALHSRQMRGVFCGLARAASMPAADESATKTAQ
jgi:uncharacterized protein YndB with AHSA1/START domain